MHSGRKFTAFQTIKWTKQSILIFVLWSAAVAVVHEFFGQTWLRIPWLPIALIGVALAFYLGFKNNSAYGRLWEGRQVWGDIINASRSWGLMVIDYPNYPETNKDSLIKDFIYTHIAWLTTLRFSLRQLKPWEHQDPKSQAQRKEFYVPEYRTKLEDELAKYLSDEEIKDILGKKVHPTHVLKLQSSKLKKLKNSNAIDSYTYMKMADLLKQLVDLQGKCERIKNFPLPRQYASTSMVFVKIFLFLLPFGLIGEFEKISHTFAWLVIPFSTLISWVFLTMELIGDYSENPFEGLANDVPISQLCQVIEIDLKQMIGDSNLPESYPIKKEILY